MGEEHCRVPLLQESHEGKRGCFYISEGLPRKFLIESRALWKIGGAAIFSRFATFGLNVITQAFVGHIGDLELAAFSFVISLIVGFTSGLIIGMGTALGTLCGQAYGAKKAHMMGIYMQRSWILLTGFAVLTLPVYIFTTPILKLAGQPDEIAELAFQVSMWCIPMHFSFVLYYTLMRFLQAQSKNFITAWSSALGAVLNLFLCWLLISKLGMGLTGALVALNVGWWTPVIIMFIAVTCGWCPDSWTGYSREAFRDLWPFFKLCTASGLMLCMELWYYKLLVLVTGNVDDAEVAVDSVSICLNINSWEMAIPLGFLAATSVRVANELGAGRPEGAKFAVINSVLTSTVIGLLILILLLAFRSEFGKLFTNSVEVQEAVYKLAILLAFTVLLNSVQPVLIGVAVGLGWQSLVACINIVCYFLVGIPFGLVLGYYFRYDVMGIWAGMIGGTAVQTLALTFMTIRIDWELEAKNIETSVSTWSTAKPPTHTNQDPENRPNE